MTPTETATTLRHYNAWRRGNLEDQPMPDPREIGKAIDAAIAMIEQLEAAESRLHEVAVVCATAEQERDELLARIEAMERQEPVATVIKKGADRYWMSERMSALPDGTHPLYLAPGAQPAPSLPDTHNDMVVGLDYQGAMSCARQRAKKEAGLLYPEGDARKEEKDRELASEYYRQYTTPNPEAKP